jgi:hypothetical protein
MSIKLRPHHLLCTQGYSGKGYDNGFVANMTAITTALRDDPNAMVEIVFSTDAICSRCPRMLGAGLCKDDDKVRRYDRKVTEYFGLQERSYSYREITREINSKMTAAIMDDICSDCSWYPVSACKRNILG